MLANLVLMLKTFADKPGFKYWLKVFAAYALAEAFVQLMFFIVLNKFGASPLSIIEIHLLMWFFQCLFILPIWWVAWWVRKTFVWMQIFVNLSFYIIYSYAWFGPIQDLIGVLYNHLIEITRSPADRIDAVLDDGNKFSYINYQLLKHSFRLAWFYLALYFYNYQLEEKKKIQLAVANHDLQLKMLKWHLNPSFYFKTIRHLQHVANKEPSNATVPILQMAKVMEYAIYDAKEKFIDVKKELQFLNSYIDLMNQQEQKPFFTLSVSGNYERLKIAPLLLVAFVEKIATPQNKKSHLHEMLLHFSENEMQATFNIGQQFNPVTDTQLKRLEQLYSNRYSIHPSAHEFKLTIQLDEE